MGSTKTVTESAQTTTPTPTAEETALNKLRLEQQQAIQPQAIDIQKQAYGLGSKLLQGQDLPGYLSSLPQGVQPEQIPLSAGVLDENATNAIVQQSLRQLYPQFQAMGLPIESGVAQSIATRTAGDIYRNTAESNLSRQLGIREANINTSQNAQYQNLNNLFNLLNLAVGGQAQIQQPVIATGGQLSQALAGLRSTSTTGTQSVSSNPFLNSFYSSLGQGLGELPGKAAGAMKFFGGSCWVASEIFGGWFEPKTCAARYYVNIIAPEWFKNFYIKYGERIAKFIHNKPVFKLMLRPLFEYFAYRGNVIMNLAGGI